MSSSVAYNPFEEFANLAQYDLPNEMFSFEDELLVSQLPLQLPAATLADHEPQYYSSGAFELTSGYSSQEESVSTVVTTESVRPQTALFPPASACTPPPERAGDYISRRESLDSEFDFLAFGRDELAIPSELGDCEERSEVDLGAIESKTYPLVRGLNSGGSTTKPPPPDRTGRSQYLKCKLSILDGDEEAVCLPEWGEDEKADKRRIIRIERRQRRNEVIVSFHILGSADQHETRPAPDGVDVVEVSCLECYQNLDYSEDDDTTVVTRDGVESLSRQFYITSVEVIKIVELLIGSQSTSQKERRAERGRIRSNLVPFWSKKPISSKKVASSDPDGETVGKTNADLRNELAQRIMSYETRKPRRFDKEVRVLEWRKLVPALRRALQSYYVKIPNDAL
ncbi:hypothetical protein KL930_002436 [Ogataea haglerorum]|uniref:DUF7082 domain-containing protein n=1 Tax=Ogataea haglerorum TaxID=1937702 RepID=A0AAN6D7T2_9ASCO|nr:uncharacterized protein KL911_002262 [Ogataea haglerorum]KAG7697114.1 hypothetical protein KL915_002377 [Ogataea haglerorum]KAG7697198.1 hypothetical protein KL951_002560 [Ogataea haglerorum]KAG7707784.1 hypothetical protein KL914_002605 [Ogataea haglerorum]KAG7709821.1 hypothetical protein KL950_002040 [Ogataea haglerorum]KAG7719900.1 hypothetical protein KL913_001869 [Ogataea haglerorum]